MSNETKWTQGEWAVLSRNSHEIQTSFIGVKIGGDYVEIGFWNPQNKANAHLIAAAPDLYAALDELCGGFTEKSYRAMMVDANCHSGICSIDKCGQCSRQLKAIRAMDKARGEL